jgi:ketosteroid isomerase-like protein
MSEENVEILRRVLAYYEATGDHLTEAYASDFVWDMSNYCGWPEQAIYEGVDGMRRFLEEWSRVFDWEYEVESLHDAGDRLVTIVSQRGRTKSAGPAVEMCSGLVWTLRDGRVLRVENYADPDEALRAAGFPGEDGRPAL